MPTLHSTLLGTENHEVLGVDTALAGQVLSADGAGHGVFVDPTSLVTLDTTSSVSASSTTSILPASLDSQITATFSANASNSDVVIDTAGTITIQTSGTYFVNFKMNLGRTGTTGVAYVYCRVVLNNVQFGETITSAISATASTWPVQTSLFQHFTAGDVIKVQLYRDSAGNNDGGFIALPASPIAWTDGAAYSVIVTKIAGGA